MKQLPLKMRILEYAIEKNEPFKVSEVMDALADEFKNERFFNSKHVELLIGAYCGVCVMKAVNFQFDKNNNLDVDYIVTEFGKNYKKLIPA